MRTKVKLCAVMACVLLALVAAVSSSPEKTRAAQETKAAAPVSSARALNAQERRGRMIYLRGETASGREIGALVGELDVPASTVTCAGCHGARGEGKTEGGVTAGNLTWSNLLKPYGHTHPTGRRHGPFDEASFARALSGGVDPAGNELLVAMPRYKIHAEDLADLVAYLKRIESDSDPGLTEEVIQVGTLLPSGGPLAETGAAMRDVLAAYFAEVNGRGGIYKRKIELRVVDSGGGAGAALAAARREQVFAFVGVLSAGADVELAAFAREEEVPFVGASTLLPQTGTPPNRYVFHILPGVGEQARALVNFAASKPELKGSRAVVVHAENDLAAAAAAAEGQARKSGWGGLTRLSYARGSFDAARLAQTLKQQGAGVVFFFGSVGDDAALVSAAPAEGWTPHVFLLGVMTGKDLPATLPTAFGGKMFLAFPTVPADLTPAGLTEFRALADKYKLAPRHTASQLSALAAAKIFVEGLSRSGRDLTREKLVTALEGLYNFETGLTPRLTFGPNRRVGAAGAYVVTIDAVKKEFVPAGGWVKAY